MNDQVYTLADLTKATGAKRRTVQLWAEAGVLVADPASERAGSGTHRTFSTDEVVVGCFVNALAQRGISIGKLVKFSTIVRRHALSSGPHRDAIRQAIDDTVKVYVIVGPDGLVFFKESDDVKKVVLFVLERLGDTEMSAVVIYLNGCLSRAHGYLA